MPDDHDHSDNPAAPDVATALWDLLDAIHAQTAFGAIDAGFGRNGAIARAYAALGVEPPPGFRKWLTTDEAAEVE